MSASASALTRQDKQKRRKTKRQKDKSTKRAEERCFLIVGWQYNPFFLIGLNLTDTTLHQALYHRICTVTVQLPMRVLHGACYAYAPSQW